MAVDGACSNRLPCLKFVGDTHSVSALIVPVLRSPTTATTAKIAATKQRFYFVDLLVSVNDLVSSVYVVPMNLQITACTVVQAVI